MSIPEKLVPQFSLLTAKLEKQTEKFRANSDWCWMMTRNFRFTGFVLSALITVVAGWHYAQPNPSMDAILRNVLLILGAASTFLASAAAFWNLERYFLENRVIYEGLRKLRDRLKYLKSRATEITEAELDALWAELEGLAMRRADYWQQALQSTQRSSNTSDSADSKSTSG